MKTLIKRIMPVLLAIVTILTVASFNTASAKGYNSIVRMQSFSSSSMNGRAFTGRVRSEPQQPVRALPI